MSDTIWNVNYKTLRKTIYIFDNDSVWLIRCRSNNFHMAGIYY